MNELHVILEILFWVTLPACRIEQVESLDTLRPYECVWGGKGNGLANRLTLSHDAWDMHMLNWGTTSTASRPCCRFLCRQDDAGGPKRPHTQMGGRFLSPFSISNISPCACEFQLWRISEIVGLHVNDGTSLALNRAVPVIHFQRAILPNSLSLYFISSFFLFLFSFSF
jgi:hypothetical protein